MPKRSPGKQKPNGQAASERPEETSRAAKSKTVLDEEANRRALDEAAGVGAREREVWQKKDPEIAAILYPDSPKPATALLKTDTREKLLYKIACAGTPLGAEFFDNFPDRQEILELALSISARLCVVAICNGELAPTQRIACMRLVAALCGKQLPAEEDPTVNRPAPPFSIPAGGTDDVQKSLDKFRELSKAS
jgi:hypothetical protein